MNSEQIQHIITGLNEDVRLDGRKALEYRDIEVEYGISNSAEGSARVRIGETEVLAGVKMEIGTPFPDKPGEGTIIVGAELLPLSSPDFESGPPSIQAIELARVIDRGIRESEAIDFKELCITEGEKVWLIVIDICTLNDAGNLFDASALAVLAALKDAHFPGMKESGAVDYKVRTDKKVNLKDEPLSITVMRIGDKYIVDPITQEELAADARMTVGVRKDGKLCSLQKGGNSPLSAEDIDNMMQIAVDKAEELRGKL